MQRFISTLSIVAAMAALMLASPVEAASLDSAVDSITDRIEAYLKEKNQLQINIGQFNGPPGSSSGRKLKNMLELELKSRNIDIAPFSRWEVRGDFEVNTDGDFATVAVITRLVNQQGEEVADFRQRVRDSIDNLKDVLDISQPASVDLESAVTDQSSSTVASSTGTSSSGTVSSTSSGSVADGERPTATVSGTQPAGPPPSSSSGGTATGGTAIAQNPPAAGNPPAGGSQLAGGTVTGTGLQNTSTAILPDDATRDGRLIESIRNPGFHQINPSTIAASASSPYHIQVKVQRGGSIYEPLDIKEVGNGLAFCDLQDGDHYSIVVTNTAPHDVGVELMIDGINSLHFSEVPGFAETGKWLIRGTNNNGGVPFSARIDGWYRNPQSVYAFRVGSEPDAVASQLGFPEKVGTITATFYGAWVGDDVHPLEAQLAAKLGTSRGLGTSKGPEISSQSNIVERKFGRFPLASMSVRYVNPEPPIDLPIEPAN